MNKDCGNILPQINSFSESPEYPPRHEYMLNNLDHSICIAPMLDKTDRHYRFFARQITQHAVLYSEMITTGALLKGDAHYHLRHHTEENPLALQLGGSNHKEMALCAQLGEDFGYDEININVGCPSDRVQSGRFGACLMAEPDLVGECVSAMQDKVNIPITVKTRIGIDDKDSYAELCRFVQTVADAGCGCFIIHARKAWLKGLSPRENREIPPLQYPLVYRLKQDFSQLEIIINGGIRSLQAIDEHLKKVDGVMIGREAYSNPYLLRDIDRLFYGDDREAPDRAEIMERLTLYLEDEVASGTQLKHMTRHLLGLYQGMPGAKKWRRTLSTSPQLSISELRSLGADLASGKFQVTQPQRSGSSWAE